MLDNESAECAVDFTYIPNVEDLSVRFSNQSIGNYDRYHWDFGDGTFSDEASPSHTFEDNGFKQVCLTVFDSYTDCQSSSCVSIDLSDPNAVACQAAFDVFYDVENKSVDFINQSQGSADSYLWNFGDGNTSTQENPSHSYDELGYYGSSLTIYHNASACQSSLYLPIELIDESTMACFAEFTYYAGTGDTVYFENTSKGEYEEYFWIFGDGNVSRQAHPSHQYRQGGIYNVTLNVFNSSTGCHSVVEQQVEVINENVYYCNAQFSHYPRSTGDVMFSYEAVGEITDAYWNFGDNTYSNLAADQVHAYSRYGTYDVCLTVIDTVDVCIHTYCSPVTGGVDNGSQDCNARSRIF